jgi:hypothetical protein
MKDEPCHVSKDYRKAARDLFTAVGKLIEEAIQTGDPRRQRKLYLEAMSMSDKAYNLLGKARNIRRQMHAAEKTPEAKSRDSTHKTCLTLCVLLLLFASGLNP